MKRSGFNVMSRLVGLVKPLAGYMLLAITMGLIGHLCATFITVFGGFAVLHILHPEWSMSLGVIFAAVLVFALVRGFLRYAEQACNHFRTEVAFHGAAAEKVTFAYGEETILDDFSVEIPENKIIGIVGRSGSGKSTLLKLFMRFWQVQQGAVMVSGRSVDEINTTDLRDMESFVTQETHLFHDSIRNNLRIAKLDASDDEIIAACKKASVHDFIMSLPQGYDTPVGELGDTLSGGERQRLGLARAFLHDAPFMLLDEPTSNLDSLNEAVILKALHEERAHKTVVLVSHRKSTMGIVDQAYSVEHGRMS